MKNRTSCHVISDNWYLVMVDLSMGNRKFKNTVRLIYITSVVVMFLCSISINTSTCLLLQRTT